MAESKIDDLLKMRIEKIESELKDHGYCVSPKRFTNHDVDVDLDGTIKNSLFPESSAVLEMRLKIYASKNDLMYKKLYSIVRLTVKSD